MKKVCCLLALIVVSISCDIANELTKLNVNNEIIETIGVSISKTNGSPITFEFNKEIDLNSGQFADYIDQIKAVKINRLTYKFKDFQGNANGTITTSSLKLGAIELTSLSNVDIQQAVNEGTVFEISDASKLTTLYMNNFFTTP